MTQVTAWRIISAATGSDVHVMSLVTDGTSAYYVYPEGVEFSDDDDPESEIAGDIEWNGGKPTDPEGWLRLALTGGTFYGAQDIAVKEDADMASVVDYEYGVLNVPRQTPEDRQLSDDLTLVVAENPELDNYFSTDDPNSVAPDSMRDFIRTIIMSRGTWDDNPGLHEWLNGGPAPTEDTGPLILVPPTAEEQ